MSVYQAFADYYAERDAAQEAAFADWLTLHPEAQSLPVAQAEADFRRERAQAERATEEAQGRREAEAARQAREHEVPRRLIEQQVAEQRVKQEQRAAAELAASQQFWRGVGF
jgi:hypothetical protein